MEVNDVVGEIITSLKDNLIKIKSFLIGYEIFAFIVGIIVALVGSSSANSEDSGNLFAWLINALSVGMFGIPLGILLIIVVGIIYWFPSTLAKKRGHAYVGMIQILNIAALIAVLPWFIALAWAAFPTEKSLIDPIVGNVTGLGRRNAGDTMGSAAHGSKRGSGFESNTDELIDKLIEMHTKGLINDDEFARKKREIIQRSY